MIPTFLPDSHAPNYMPEKARLALDDLVGSMRYDDVHDVHRKMVDVRSVTKRVIPSRLAPLGFEVETDHGTFIVTNQNQGQGTQMCPLIGRWSDADTLWNGYQRDPNLRVFIYGFTTNDHRRDRDLVTI